MRNPVGSRRLQVLAGGVVVVASFMIGIAWRTGSTTSDRAECSPGASIPASLSPSDVRLRPFSSDSPWNQTIPSQQMAAIEEASSSELTTAFRAGTPTGRPDELGTVHTWVNSERYSLPIYQADPCDPIVQFDQDWQSESLDGMDIRIPDDAVPAAGTDANLLIVQPDGRTLLELFRATQIDRTTWHTSRIELVDLKGTGMGPDNGVRAFGGSAYGGLIRRWEVDPTDPDYGDGVIDHGLAIAVPNSMLRFTGGDPGRDADGFGTSKGYVAPATEQDFDSKWVYRGVIPMGSKVVLPASVDVDSLGLGPEARSIAVALQRHGGYVADRSGDGVVTFYAEPGVPASWLEGARREVDGVYDLDVLRSQLVIVPSS